MSSALNHTKPLTEEASHQSPIKNQELQVFSRWVNSIRGYRSLGIPTIQFRMEWVLIQEGLQAVVTEPQQACSGCHLDHQQTTRRHGHGRLSVCGLKISNWITSSATKKQSKCGTPWRSTYHERSSLSNKFYVLWKLCSQRTTFPGYLNEATVMANRLTALRWENTATNNWQWCWSF